MIQTCHDIFNRTFWTDPPLFGSARVEKARARGPTLSFRAWGVCSKDPVSSFLDSVLRLFGSRFPLNPWVSGKYWEQHRSCGTATRHTTWICDTSCLTSYFNKCMAWSHPTWHSCQPFPFRKLPCRRFVCVALPETISKTTPEIQWLEDGPFPFGFRPIFMCELLNFRVPFQRMHQPWFLRCTDQEFLDIQCGDWEAISMWREKVTSAEVKISIQGYPTYLSLQGSHLTDIHGSAWRCRHFQEKNKTCNQ